MFRATRGKPHISPYRPTSLHTIILARLNINCELTCPIVVVPNRYLLTGAKVRIAGGFVEHILHAQVQYLGANVQIARGFVARIHRA